MRAGFDPSENVITPADCRPFRFLPVSSPKRIPHFLKSNELVAKASKRMMFQILRWMVRSREHLGGGFNDQGHRIPVLHRHAVCIGVLVPSEPQSGRPP